MKYTKNTLICFLIFTAASIHAMSEDEGFLEIGQPSCSTPFNNNDAPPTYNQVLWLKREYNQLLTEAAELANEESNIPFKFLVEQAYNSSQVSDIVREMSKIKYTSLPKDKVRFATTLPLRAAILGDKIDTLQALLPYVDTNEIDLCACYATNHGSPTNLEILLKHKRFNKDDMYDFVILAIAGEDPKKVELVLKNKGKFPLSIDYLMVTVAWTHDSGKIADLLFAYGPLKPSAHQGKDVYPSLLRAITNNKPNIVNSILHAKINYHQWYDHRDELLSEAQSPLIKKILLEAIEKHKRTCSIQ